MSVRSPVSDGVRTALAVLGLLIALWLVVQLRSILVLLLISAVLATAIYPGVEWLSTRRLPPKGWHIPRWLSIFTSLLAIVITALGLSYFLGAAIWKEGGDAWKGLPSYLNGMNGWLEHLRKQFPAIPSEQDLGNAARTEVGRLGNYLWQTTSAVLGVLGSLGSALTVLVFAFYMLLERETIRSACLSLVPPDHQARFDEATSEALLTMGGWLRGQTILALAMMALISAAMAALGIPHPVLLGIVGGIGELIPMVGPIVAGIVAVPLAFFTMPLWVALVALVFFVILSTIEGNVIVPKVMQKNVELSPFFTVVAIFAGVTLFGILGALLAIPVAAALRVYLKRLVVPAIQKRRNHRPDRKPDQ
jgi:predicted PurR-regulated permease PerM